MIRAFQNTLLRTIPRYYFTTPQSPYATAPAYLAADKIKESLGDEEYNRLADIVKAKEQNELNLHNQRLSKLRK